MRTNQAVDDTQLRCINRESEEKIRSQSSKVFVRACEGEEAHPLVCALECKRPPVHVCHLLINYSVHIALSIHRHSAKLISDKQDSDLSISSTGHLLRRR